MILDKKNWQKCVKGFTVLDCTSTNTERFFLVLVEDQNDDLHHDPGPRIRFLSLYGDEPMDDRWYYHDYYKMDFPRCSVALLNNGKPEFIAMDISGHTYFLGNGKDGQEEPLNTALYNDNIKVTISGIKRVNGQIYALGRDHLLFKRKHPHSWQLVPGLSRPEERKNGKALASRFGFKDMDAFSENDMYAVGGQGDVWHFDGNRWEQCPFPSNELVETVCCAGDDNVYITGNMGSLWEGRNNRWKRLLDGEFSISFSDTVWFADRLWCGSDYGLWTLKDGKLVIPEDMPEEVRSACGVTQVSLDGSHIITAGPYGASIYDGKNWELLFSSSEFADK